MSLRHLPLICNIFRQFPLKTGAVLGRVSRLRGDALKESISNTKSLELNNDLVADILKSKQSFPSFLESRSSTLESIDAVTSGNPEDWYDYCIDKIFNTLISMMADFDYPNLKHIELSVSRVDDSQSKRLMRRCRNLRSIILHLSHEFVWPEDFILEKLEKLVIQFSYDCDSDVHKSCINVSLHSLIGKAPKLKQMKIDAFGRRPPKLLFLKEFSPLLASTPSLEKLDLDSSCYCYYSDLDNFVTQCLDLSAAIPISNLSNLTHLKIYLEGKKCPKLSKCFSFREEQLSFSWRMIKKIDNQDMELSQPRYLQEVELSEYELEMTKEMLTKIITVLPSIDVLKISRFGTSESPKAFVEFVTSTASLFHRNLEIRLKSMYVHGNKTELFQMIATLDKVKKNGGPVVESQRMDKSVYVVNPDLGHPHYNQYDRWQINTIHYRP